jgi:hypothetical protein
VSLYVECTGKLFGNDAKVPNVIIICMFHISNMHMYLLLTKWQCTFLKWPTSAQVCHIPEGGRGMGCGWLCSRRPISARAAGREGVEWRLSNACAGTSPITGSAHPYPPPIVSVTFSKIYPLIKISDYTNNLYDMGKAQCKAK